MKVINKSKRHLLKIRKQKLCNRINQAKSQKELEGWEKVFSYHPVLKDDFDWDYYFLINLIEFKLKRMRQYFWTHNIVEGEHEYGNICDKLINILNAGYKTDIISEDDLKGIYVNDKNASRYFKPQELEFLKHENLKRWYLPNIREQKAKKIFWKYLFHKIECLWD